MRYSSVMNLLVTGNQSATCLRVAAAVPAAAMLWILIAWTPRGRRQWLLAAAMMAYIGCYYFLLVRGR